MFSSISSDKQSKQIKEPAELKQSTDMSDLQLHAAELGLQTQKQKSNSAVFAGVMCIAVFL
jgi:hypothetical protein